MKETKTLKNYEIVDILKELNDPDSIINSKSSDTKLPVKILWTISGNIKKLNDILDLIQEQEQAINDSYFNEEKSEVNDEGLYVVKSEFRNDFIKEKNDLMVIENEVELSMINLSDIQDFNFRPSDFMSINFMIFDDSNAETD